MDNLLILSSCTQFIDQKMFHSMCAVERVVDVDCWLLLWGGARVGSLVLKDEIT